MPRRNGRFLTEANVFSLVASLAVTAVFLLLQIPEGVARVDDDSSTPRSPHQPLFPLFPAVFPGVAFLYLRFMYSLASCICPDPTPDPTLEEPEPTNNTSLWRQLRLTENRNGESKEEGQGDDLESGPFRSRR